MTKSAQELASKWSGLPKKVARKLAENDGGLRVEIESACQLALCKAAMTYDPEKLVRHPDGSMRPCRPSTYFWSAVRRESRKALARYLKRQEGTESLGKGEGMVPDQAEGSDPASDPTLFGSMQAAVDALPAAERKALAAWFARPGTPPLASAPRIVRAALARLAGECVVSDVPEKGTGGVGSGVEGDPSSASASWSPEEKAFLWRMLRAGRCRAGSKGERRCAERLGRTVKSVRRRVARMAAAGEVPKESKEAAQAMREERSILTPEADARRRAAEAGWEILDGGFFGEPMWVHEVSGDVLAWDEVVARLGKGK